MTAATRKAAARQSAMLPALVLPLSATATLLSAALLFSVQPMFAKLVLPVLGGSPSVWSVATVFFQALLLAGYAYAHLIVRHCGPRLGRLLHLGVMLAALGFLPIALPAGWIAAPADGEALWLFGLFALVIGLPFFALSANGPLLQAWYARTDLRGADNPYGLYAASNIGSFAALIAYPLLLEPTLSVRQQTEGWAIGFLVLIVLLAGGGMATLRRAAEPRIASAPVPETSSPVWTQRLGWLVLSLIPSGLLVSVTAHISTDVAAVPLLWVIPLALFLLTFVFAFADRTLLPVRWLARVQVALVALALFTLVMPLPLWAGVPVHLLAFFTSALLCHTALYRQRPAPQRLTEFYLFMSLGGCLGGAFSALLAPQIFASIIEYPMLLVLALACRSGIVSAGGQNSLVEAGRTLLVAATVLICGGLFAPLLPAGAMRVVLAGFLALVLIAAADRPGQALALGVALALAATILPLGASQSVSFRSFFGVHKLAVSGDGRFLTLSHGTTIHGATRLRNTDGAVATGRPEPLTYYTAEGALGTGIAALRVARGGVFGDVAVIGLGAGSLACHARPEERWRFYEIDPVVVRIARDPAMFEFLSACAPTAEIVLGDARLTYGRSALKSDLLVLDAFSSDAIPAHLVTVEALRLYGDSLAPGGAMLVHITNRNLDLSRILARTAAEAGLVTFILDEAEEEAVDVRFRARTTVLALARHPDHLGTIATAGIWRELVPDLSRRPWTDDWSNIVEAMLDRARGT